MSGMPEWVRVGAKCICVNVLPAVGPHANRRPQRGSIYTVVGWEWGDVSMAEIGVGIYWDVSQFRPLVDDAENNEIGAQIYHKLRVRTTTHVKERLAMGWVTS